MSPYLNVNRMPDEKSNHLKDLFEYQVIERLNKLQEHYATMNAQLSAMVVIQSKQEENLREHMKRTALNEQEIRRVEEAGMAQVAPVVAHVNRLQGAWKLVASASGLAVVITVTAKAAYWLWGYLHQWLS